jgi:hypothetical protein
MAQSWKQYWVVSPMAGGRQMLPGAQSSDCFEYLQEAGKAPCPVLLAQAGWALVPSNT